MAKLKIYHSSHIRKLFVNLHTTITHIEQRMKKATSLVSLLICILGILTAQVTYAQPSRKDYKKISNVTYYGAVFEGTRILKARQTATEYKQFFDDINAYYQENSEAISSGLKKYLKLTLDGVDVSYANAANARISELELFTYKNHSTPGTYQDLQKKLEKLRIPKKDGYGMVLFSYLIDYKEAEFKYDVVFFDLKTMRIIAFGDSESERLAKGSYKEFLESVPDAINEYPFR